MRVKSTVVQQTEQNLKPQKGHRINNPFKMLPGICAPCLQKPREDIYLSIPYIHLGIVGSVWSDCGILFVMTPHHHHHHHQRYGYYSGSPFKCACSLGNNCDWIRLVFVLNLSHHLEMCVIYRRRVKTDAASGRKQNVQMSFFWA